MQNPAKNLADKVCQNYNLESSVFDELLNWCSSNRNHNKNSAGRFTLPFLRITEISFVSPPIVSFCHKICSKIQLLLQGHEPFPFFVDEQNPGPVDILHNYSVSTCFNYSWIGIPKCCVFHEEKQGLCRLLQKLAKIIIHWVGSNLCSRSRITVASKPWIVLPFPRPFRLETEALDALGVTLLRVIPTF